MPAESLNGAASGPANGAHAPDAARTEVNPARIARAFARCFASVEGEFALRHLDDMTLRRALGPEASEAMLRHLEGQRQFVAYIHALVARGRAGL